MQNQLAERPKNIDFPASSESDFVALLSHHYGDGIVYLYHRGALDLYKQAIEMGYVSEEGYLTRKGRTLLAQSSQG